MQLTETIKTRRSIHEFIKDSISIEDINEILEAGIYAPSAKNRQPWFFHVICDAISQKKFLEDMNRGILELARKYEEQNIPRPDIECAKYTLKSMKNASAIILVTCQKKYTDVFEDDVHWSLYARDIEVTDILSIGAAIQNILLKATDMGYGSLWVCDIFYAYPQMVKFLQTDAPIVSAICIGKTAFYPPNSSRLPLREVSNFTQNKEYN